MNFNENTILTALEDQEAFRASHDEAVNYIMTQLKEDNYKGYSLTDVLLDAISNDVELVKAILEVLNKNDTTTLQYSLNQAILKFATDLLDKEIFNAL